jgi:hypothetical protein
MIEGLNSAKAYWVQSHFPKVLSVNAARRAPGMSLGVDKGTPEQKQKNRMKYDIASLKNEHHIRLPMTR